MSDRRAIRCGVVGAGRTRNGLGPFMARDLERAGAEVVAVVGRDQARAEAAAVPLRDQLGHDLAAHGSVAEMMAAHELDGMVIASPVATHLAALRAAAAAGVAALGEKPLVTPEEHGEVPGLIAAFAERGTPLLENCQLPHVLGVFDTLFPGLRQGRIESLELRMAPSGTGRTMVVDSASHLLSLVQSVVPIDASTRVRRLEISDRSAASERTEVVLELESPFPTVRCTLYLERCAEQPRPQWIALNGQRVERRIQMSDYSMGYWDGQRGVPVADPLAAQVRAFVQIVGEPDRDRIRAESDAILERARLYRDIVAAWDA
ncbi:MAG: Gfo/Idh/MocA family oxidoreductase [Planctomycetota bacterium]